MKLTLPTNSEERKNVPVLSGALNYFPAAIAWIARISLKGDRKHNPENKGPPFHARGKSMDHGDCIIRHTMDIEDLKAAYAREALVSSGQQITAQLIEEAAYRAWRSCAELQELCEKYDGAPAAPAAKFPDIYEQITAAVRASDRQQVASINNDIFANAQRQNATKTPDYGDILDAEAAQQRVERRRNSTAAEVIRDAEKTPGGLIDATLAADVIESRRMKAMRGRLEGEKLPPDWKHDEGTFGNGH